MNSSCLNSAHCAKCMTYLRFADAPCKKLASVESYREKKPKLDLIQKLATRWRILQNIVLFTSLAKPVPL